jgi:putative dehydrogenase
VTASADEIGVIGLGMMGGGIARHALGAGFTVHGYDIREDAVAAFRELGGRPATSPGELAERARIVVTSLPSLKAFREVVSLLAPVLTAGQLVVETSTLPLSEKFWMLGEVQRSGATALDCTLSGTGGQMRTKDIVVYASGDQEAIERCRPLFASFSRGVYALGEFGNGSRIKYIANHLVTVHNVAAAEALLLARAAGLDLQTTLEAISDGAGTSRMLEVRGPMMVAGDYSDATMRVDTYQKDIDTIAGFAHDLHVPLPLFSASALIYQAALSQGRQAEDTAVVFAALQRLVGSADAGS